MRGRKPKPTAQRRLEGNPGKRRLNEDEPKPPAPSEEFDVPPPELAEHAIAAAEWSRLAPMLRAVRVITEADRSALLALCLEWGRYIDATAQTKRSGMVIQTKSGYPITNPYLAIAVRALAGCQKLWTELGLTPSSRARVHTVGPLPAAGEQETTVARLQRQALALRRPVAVKR
jgi:P27 family predicted phage terminase small subunit